MNIVQLDSCLLFHRYRIHIAPFTGAGALPMDASMLAHVFDWTSNSLTDLLSCYTFPVQNTIKAETSKSRRNQRTSGVLTSMTNKQALPFDAAYFLDSDEAISGYLSEASATQDAAFISHSLAVVARAKGSMPIPPDTTRNTSALN
jgi:hypothetical protein